MDNLIKYIDITIPYSANTYISENGILDGRKFIEYYNYDVSKYIPNGKIIACTALNSEGYMETAEISRNKFISASQFIYSGYLNDEYGYIKVRVLYID